MTAPLPLLRNAWRQLTSMRTALVLLFLLAVAAIPGSLLPQKNLGIEKVTAYVAQHPKTGPLFDKLFLYEVYSSPWFSAIYLLLFVSLVGCLVPRLRDHAAALRRRPPQAPSRLDRLPAYAAIETDHSADDLARLLKGRRFRTEVRTGDDGTVTVAGEKGYLKETGNLLFHFALLALLVGVALGSWYGWHGNRLVVAGADGAFCDTVQQYDEVGLGARVGAGDLPPFCVQLDDFTAKYLDSGQPVQYTARVAWSAGTGPDRPYTLEVNSPLRLSGANVYLLGHGYAPVIRYTDRYGKAQTTVAPFLPTDPNLTSEGVAAFPDANLAPGTGTRSTTEQVAFSGIYVPTRGDGGPVVISKYPTERSPALTLVTYRGDLGLDSGRAQSVYTLDQRQIQRGKLNRVEGAAFTLKPGESRKLDDGSVVEFIGTRPWVTVQVRHDPGEPVVLAGAAAMLLGLLPTLFLRRRRVWFRLSSTSRRVEAGGLPRTEYAGFAAEFDALVAAARAGSSPPVAAARKD